VIFTIRPDLAERLELEAKKRQIDPTKLLEVYIEEYLSSHPPVEPKYKTPQERITAMDAVAEKYANAPILPDSAFDRENIYEDKL
jgi:hypothetical protein